MRITYLTFGEFTTGPDGRQQSTFASARYRVLVPAQYLAERGHEVKIQTINDGQITPQAIAAMQADVVICMKSYFRVDGQLARHAKSHGAQLVLDLSDNHFEHPQHAGRCREMADLADVITCNTPVMAEIAGQYTQTPTTVIADPYEGPAHPPRFQPTADALKAVWFGHASNLDTLLACMGQFKAFAEHHPLHLTLVSKPVEGMLKFSGLLQQALPGRLQVTFIPWSMEAQWQAIADNDLVVIPTSQADTSRTKSANRMFESFRAGRMVVAQPLPAYTPFNKVAWIGDDIAEGLQWTLDHADTIEGRITRAQKYIEDTFAPNVIGKRWELTCRKLLKRANA